MDAQDEIIMEDLEDGEISSNSCDEYTPLERPQNYSEVVQPVIQDSDSESEEPNESSDDDSDDSVNILKPKNKRRKIKLKPKAPSTNARKKFDIWTTSAREDVLSETLNTCDVTQKDRSRDVESYDFNISYPRSYFQTSNKRTREDRKDIHRRLGQRKLKDGAENDKGACRTIPDLHTNIENTEEDIAKDMANKLCEMKEELLVRSLKLLGKEKCFEIFKKTQEIEADGGMSVMNFTRRRTPGGVFFYLLKIDDNIEQKTKSDIFIEERKRDSKEKKRRQVQKWRQQKDRERAQILPELLSKADLLIKNRHLKEVSDAVFRNPPPTPETDGQENSCDDVECPASSDQTKENIKSKTEEGIAQNSGDILDLHCSNMDQF